ncbi:MAG: vitamin B12 dependent-methionine synthase activation domain-containing protein, partial [Omnitrophica WOR_2 bacterium]
KLAAMNPGSLEDWPLSEQNSLFALLGDVTETTGVRLTDSMLMQPTKSVSGIYFTSAEGFASCQLCPRQACPNRRATYDPDLFQQKYARVA